MRGPACSTAELITLVAKCSTIAGGVTAKQRLREASKMNHPQRKVRMRTQAQRKVAIVTAAQLSFVFPLLWKWPRPKQQLKRKIEGMRRPWMWFLARAVSRV